MMNVRSKLLFFDDFSPGKQEGEIVAMQVGRVGCGSSQ